MRTIKIFYFVFAFSLVVSTCTPAIPRVSSTPVGINTNSPTITQTLPTEINTTPTPNPILFSMKLPSYVSNFGPELISPDSEWIAFEVFQSAGAEEEGEFANIMLYQRSLETWTKILSEDELNDFRYYFAFSPDSHYLAAKGRSGIWFIDLCDLSKKTYYNLPILGRTAFEIKWTPDSKSLLFAIEDEKYIMAQVSLDGKIKNILSSNDVFQGKSRMEYNDALYFLTVTFSPDGTKIAYVSIIPETIGCPELWIYDLVLKKKELTLEKQCDIGVEPIWSPVDSVIAFVGYSKILLFDLNTRSVNTIYLKNKSTSHTKLLWSPDGKKIIFNDETYSNEDNHIFLYDLNKKELRTVLVGNYHLTSWGTTDSSIFVEYHPLHSNERYLQEIRIE